MLRLAHSECALTRIFAFWCGVRRFTAAITRHNELGHYEKHKKFSHTYLFSETKDFASSSPSLLSYP